MQNEGSLIKNSFCKKRGMDIKTQLGNVVWYIATNRYVLGDKQTLSDVLIALNRMIRDEESKRAASKS
ncbi:hypothetical protein [Bacillus mycoides]|uniref:hypothetical protein n=2 Tax=Bacillus mycoides TaxID=1405 RepID=UPI000872C3DB|nr:hypothetical protein [Bacillus mycoides]OFD37082.1 hypothetical protein BWGOE2_38080 [Bacillus mycoides]OFD43053.1 hypothetical protein BWGOE1_37940 [Bacillus mycoides]